MPQLYLNNFTTQFIASVKSAPATANPASELDYGVLRVSDGAAGTLINPPAGSWYVLTAFKRAGTLESDYEILRVTGVDNSVVGECRLTVLRGQEGTTPRAYVSGDLVELRLTAGGISQYAQTTDPRMSDPRTPTGAAGGVLAGSYPNPGFAQPMATVAQMEGRVEKVAGKGLSANDYTNADVAKLARISEQATKNAPDSQLRDRSTHTGVQAIGTVTDLQATLDGKEPVIAAGAAGQYWQGDKTWREFATDVRATVLTGLSTAANTVIAATDTVLGALGKLQAQISGHFGAGGGAHALATTNAAGFLSAADKSKLDGVAAAATENATDAQLRDRSTHTGTQAINTVSGLQAALDGKAAIEKTREVLTAARTYYVRTDGNDGNSGFANTAAGAFRTVQRAVDVAASLDLGLNDVTIRATGTFAESVVLRNLTTVGGKVNIRGDVSNLTGFVMSPASGACFHTGTGFAGTYDFSYLKFAATGGGIRGTGGGGSITFGYVDFAASTAEHIAAPQGCLVVATGPYQISGGAYAHLAAYDGSLLRVQNVTVTILNNPQFTVCFAMGTRNGVLLVTGTTFNGSATGKKYSADLGGGIVTYAGSDYLPGNSAGTSTAPGWYI